MATHKATPRRAYHAPPTEGGTCGDLKDPFAELRGSTAAEMSVLRPMEKLPDLNRATVLVGAGGAPGPASRSLGRSASAASALLRQRAGALLWTNRSGGSQG